MHGNEEKNIAFISIFIDQSEAPHRIYNFLIRSNVNTL